MIQIDEMSSKPIYEQIFDEFVKLIVFKILQQDEQLPSVRELASTIRINPNTIQKAYKLLETNNYLYTIKGKGNFVNSNQITNGIFKRQLEDQLKEIIINFKKIEINDDGILSIIKSIMKEVEYNNA